MRRPTLVPSAPDLARRHRPRRSPASPPLIVAGLFATCIAACEYSQLIFVRPAATSPLGLGDPAMLALAPGPPAPTASAPGRHDATSVDRGRHSPRG